MASTSTLDLVADVRNKRLNHLGSTLRLPDSRLYKKVVTTRGPKEDGAYRNGSVFSDSPTHGSMAQLAVLASNKRGWANHTLHAYPTFSSAAQWPVASLSRGCKSVVWPMFVTQQSCVRFGPYAAAGREGCSLHSGRA